MDDRAQRRYLDRRLAPLLFLLALAAEIVSMLLLTFYRYHNQELPVHFFALSKTANVLGLLLATPFVLLFLVLAATPRLHRMSLAFAAAGYAIVGIVLLAIYSFFSPAGENYVALAYLAWKAVELAWFVVALPPRERPRRHRWFTTALLSLGLILGTYLLVILAVLMSPIGSSVVEQPRTQFDAGVILGAAVWSRDRPSPVLRQRIRKGYDLLRNGTVQFLVVTGGHAPHELSEAEVARRELIKLGADPTRIVVETHTSSTLQQILFIRNQLLNQGWSSFVIISDQFHLERALEICEFNGIDAIGVSSESPLGPENLAIYHLREAAALILYWTFGM